MFPNVRITEELPRLKATVMLGAPPEIAKPDFEDDSDSEVVEAGYEHYIWYRPNRIISWGVAIALVIVALGVFAWLTGIKPQ